MRHAPTTERYLNAAGTHRKRAENVADSVERLLAAFRSLDAVPLDVLDRVERAIVQTHVSNMLRLSERRPAPPAPAWATGSMHDLSCPGPVACECQPVYVGPRSVA